MRNKPQNPYRSQLVIPTLKMKFIEKSYLRGADYIEFDLEDSIRMEDKPAARTNLPICADYGRRGGAEIFVRINSEPELFIKDLEASVIKGVDGIIIPKAESPEIISEIDSIISRLEKEQGLGNGSIVTCLIIETAKGYLNMNSIASCSKRTRLMSLGNEDFARDMEIKLEKGSSILSVPYFNLVLACKVNGLLPVGLLESMTDYRDLEGLKKNVEKSYKAGIKGACVIHPDQVPIVNEGFAPNPLEVEYARKVVDAYYGQSGTDGAIGLEGRMIDKPVADRAQDLLDKWQRIIDFEAYKSQILSQNA